MFHTGVDDANDEHMVDEIGTHYADECARYYIQLLRLPQFEHVDTRLDDSLIALLYLRCSLLRVAGVTIFSCESALAALLVPMHILPVVIGRPMSYFTNATTVTRGAICDAIESGLFPVASLQFPV